MGSIGIDNAMMRGWPMLERRDVHLEAVMIGLTLVLIAESTCVLLLVLASDCTIVLISTGGG